MRVTTKIIFPLVILIIDQLTKEIIRRSLKPFDVIPVTPFFNIVHISNKGAAFGMMSGAGNTFFIVVSLIAISVIFYLLVKERENYLAYSLILGGATGNLVDRILYGHVTDFLDLYIGRYHWPAFNVADSVLTLGIGILALKILFKGERG